jgi:CheY-specific phosphatase CheX
MSVGATQIHKVTQQVWSTVLGMRIEPVPKGGAMTERFVSGKVRISGAWEGAVTVFCSAKLARAAASAMFALGPAEASSEEVSDAVGELANMVGGNIKTLIKGDCRLSLPAVVQGVDYLALAGAAPEALHELWFACEGGVVLISVMRT